MPPARPPAPGPDTAARSPAPAAAAAHSPPRQERASFRAIVDAAATAARVAYCAASLAHALKGTFECFRGEYKKRKYWN